MFYSNDYIAKNIKEQQVQEFVDQAAKDRLILALRSQQRNSIAQLVCRALAILGRGLFSLGHRLDQLDNPNTRLAQQDNTARV